MIGLVLPDFKTGSTYSILDFSKKIYDFFNILFEAAFILICPKGCGLTLQ